MQSGFILSSSRGGRGLGSLWWVDIGVAGEKNTAGFHEVREQNLTSIGRDSCFRCAHFSRSFLQPVARRRNRTYDALVREGMQLLLSSTTSRDAELSSKRRPSAGVVKAGADPSSMPGIWPRSGAREQAEATLRCGRSQPAWWRESHYVVATGQHWQRCSLVRSAPCGA